MKYKMLDVRDQKVECSLVVVLVITNHRANAWVSVARLMQLNRKRWTFKSFVRQLQAFRNSKVLIHGKSKRKKHTRSSRKKETELCWSKILLEWVLYFIFWCKWRSTISMYFKIFILVSIFLYTFQELGIPSSVPAHIVLHDWVRHNDGKLSLFGFTNLVRGMPPRTKHQQPPK